MEVNERATTRPSMRRREAGADNRRRLTIAEDYGGRAGIAGWRSAHDGPARTFQGSDRLCLDGALTGCDPAVRTFVIAMDPARDTDVPVAIDVEVRKTTHNPGGHFRLASGQAGVDRSPPVVSMRLGRFGGDRGVSGGERRSLS